MPLSESETLELKKSTSELKEAIISIAAMLNKHGQGEVIFGIEDNGKVVGQGIGKTTTKDISKSIQDHIEPEIFPSIAEEQIEGKTCIRVMATGSDMPYFAYGRAHTRVGDKNPVLSGRKLQELILHKNKDALRWDNKPCLGAKPEDIDPEKLRAFLKKAGLEYSSTNIALHNLGLMLSTSGAPTNAAVLLFGREPQKFIRNAQLRCAVFANPATILDMKDFEGDLFTLIEEAQAYALKNIHIGMRVEGLYRVDVPEIDPEALREAIINAFCHRDYHNPDSVRVAVFPDRVEIQSPGRLYGGMTMDKIKRGNVSERRNELVAAMLVRIHYIEGWGRGIPLILRKEPTVSFDEVGRKFITVFKRKGAEFEKGIKKTVSSYGESVDMARLRATQQLSRELYRNYPETTQKIIQEIITTPGITIKELSKKTGLTDVGVKYSLKRLKDDGLLKRVGPDKGGRWEVKG